MCSVKQEWRVLKFIRPTKNLVFLRNKINLVITAVFDMKIIKWKLDEFSMWVLAPFLCLISTKLISLTVLHVIIFASVIILVVSVSCIFQYLTLRNKSVEPPHKWVILTWPKLIIYMLQFLVKNKIICKVFLHQLNLKELLLTFFSFHKNTHNSASPPHTQIQPPTPLHTQ